MRNRVVVVGVIVAVVLALVGWRTCGGERGGGSSGTSARGAASGSAGAVGVSGVTKPRGPVKPAKLVGRVIEKANGRGIPGAIVSIARAELLQQIMPTNDVSVIAIADAQGVWTATPVFPGTYFVAATAVGFLPGSRAKLVVASGDEQTGLDLALDAGGVLVSGTVSDVGGGPIGNARITVKRDNQFDMTGSEELVSLTRDDGTFQLTVPDGNYEARASHDDYTSQRHDLEIIGEPVKLDFVLTPGGVIRGTVIARDSGKPVGGAWLMAEGKGANGGDLTARSDEAGAFALRGLRPGAQAIKAQGRGYASTSPTIVNLGVGEQVDDVKVLVDHAFSVSGRVVRKGTRDDGIPGVQLALFSLGTQQFGIALEPTDATGAFEIHGLRPASYMLFAGGEDTVPELGTPVDVVDKDVTDVTVEMSAGVTLAGRVEPPIAKARVTLQLTGEIGFTRMFEAMKSALVHGETDATGAFTMDHAPSGAFTVVAVAPAGDTGKLAITIGEADQTSLVVKLETRGSISGRVVDDKGAPVADANVDARPTERAEINFSMGERSGSTTRKDGTFKVVGLEAGTYLMRIRDNDSRGSMKLTNAKAARVTLAKAQALTGITLTVEARDGVIRGQVIGSDKKPVADAWVTAESARPNFMKKSGVTVSKSSDDDKPDDEQMAEMMDYSGPSKPVLTGTDGRFVIGKLRRGTYQVVAEGPRGTSRAEAANIKTGSSVTLVLKSLGSLTGKVTVDGKPVTAYDIACDGPGDPDSKQITAADGAYTLDRLAPGEYACDVTSDAGTASGKVTIASEPTTLDFTLARWGVLTGRVVDVLSKKPLAGLLAMPTGNLGGAQFFEDMMRGRAPKTDASGTFTLDRVAAGSGMISIMTAEMTFGAPLGTKPYTVTAGQRLDLGTIEVIPPRTGDAGTFGFSTNVTDGKLVVAYVKPDGPAAAAGLREGDTIVALSGITVESLTAGIAQQLLSSGTVGVGMPVTLTLDRAGTPATVSIVSVKW